MLDANLQAQLQAYFERISQPIELVASLDERPASQEMRELLEEIARGGMGVVYRARQISLNRIVAVKLILAGHFADPAAVRRFKAEATAAAKLRHPNIVAIYEIGEEAGQNFFSMDYVEGLNLADFMRQQPISIRQAARLLKTIAEAIHYAHEQGIAPQAVAGTGRQPPRAAQR